MAPGRAHPAKKLRVIIDRIGRNCRNKILKFELRLEVMPNVRFASVGKSSALFAGNPEQ